MAFEGRNENFPQANRNAQIRGSSPSRNSFKLLQMSQFGTSRFRDDDDDAVPLGANTFHDFAVLLSLPFLLLYYACAGGDWSV